MPSKCYEEITGNLSQKTFTHSYSVMLVCALPGNIQNSWSNRSYCVNSQTNYSNPFDSLKIKLKIILQQIQGKDGLFPRNALVI